MNVRKIRLAAGKWLLDKIKRPAPFAIGNNTKILFVRYDGKIGDFIVSSFMYREIKRAYPGSVLHMVINSKLKQLSANNTFIDKWFIMKGRSYYEMIQMSNRLRREKYDILIDATPGLRNRDLLFIRNVHATINFGYDKENYLIFNKSMPPLNEHTRDIYKRLLGAMGITDINTEYELQLNSRSEDKIKRFFSEQHIEKAVAINFFGASRSRNFSAEMAAEIIKLVLQYYPGHTIILLTFPQALQFTATLVNAFNTHRVVHYTNTETIYDTISIIARAQMLISPDTAVIHIADYFKKPMIAFYSDEKENFTRWRPLSNVPIIRYSGNVNNIDMDTFQQILAQSMQDKI